MKIEDLQGMMLIAAEEFRENLKERANLDFTQESLVVVEELIEEGIKYMKPEMLPLFVSSISAYVFEVARRMCGGVYHWDYEREQPVLVTGEPDFEVALLAQEKVKLRFTQGKAHNIPFYFEEYLKAVEEGKKEKGYGVLLV